MTYLCHKSSQVFDNHILISANTSGIGIVLLPNIGFSIGPKNPISVWASFSYFIGVFSPYSLINSDCFVFSGEVGKIEKSLHKCDSDFQFMPMCWRDLGDRSIPLFTAGVR